MAIARGSKQGPLLSQQIFPLFSLLSFKPSSLVARYGKEVGGRSLNMAVHVHFRVLEATTDLWYRISWGDLEPFLQCTFHAQEGRRLGAG